jgi:hypothetical protein
VLPALLPTPRSGGGCSAAGAAGAAVAGWFVGLAELCRGARFRVCTLICGSGLSPGTAAGGACEGVCCDGVALGGAARGPVFCADAAPTAATIAHTEPPRLNSLRTDLNTERPPSCTRTIEVALLRGTGEPSFGSHIPYAISMLCDN